MQKYKTSKRKQRIKICVLEFSDEFLNTTPKTIYERKSWQVELLSKFQISAPQKQPLKA